MRVVLALALPLFVNSSLQAILNLTDTWFISRLSPVALAAAAAIHWLVLGFIVLAGGIAMAVQTFAAQAYGARRHRQAGVALWSGGTMRPCCAAAGSTAGWLKATKQAARPDGAGVCGPGRTA